MRLTPTAHEVIVRFMKYEPDWVTAVVVLGVIFAIFRVLLKVEKGRE